MSAFGHAFCLGEHHYVKLLCAHAQDVAARRSVKRITCPVIGSKVEAPAIYVFYQQPLFASDNDKSAKLAGGRQSWHDRVSMLKSGESWGRLGAVAVSRSPYKFQKKCVEVLNAGAEAKTSTVCIYVGSGICLRPNVMPKGTGGGRQSRSSSNHANVNFKSMGVLLSAHRWWTFLRGKASSTWLTASSYVLRMRRQTFRAKIEYMPQLFTASSSMTAVRQTSCVWRACRGTASQLKMPRPESDQRSCSPLTGNFCLPLVKPGSPVPSPSCSTSTYSSFSPSQNMTLAPDISLSSGPTSPLKPRGETSSYVGATCRGYGANLESSTAGEENMEDLNI
ncbi:unnamed protein product [Chondrus crispus]|uniref:Uncharacterized protein n=1 Tax=Chondrus crispus TaxID=2769 RepID=R7QPC7_CHOCR|nr:unnamed protein product [Chondrus crispus]CDF39245.1 unnamed protein product [Chondrus crispus]|eukprot:XP_005719156.1 unnamed protein product [Chondrus crispus]